MQFDQLSQLPDKAHVGTIERQQIVNKLDNLLQRARMPWGLQSRLCIALPLDSWQQRLLLLASVLRYIDRAPFPLRLLCAYSPDITLPFVKLSIADCIC